MTNVLVILQQLEGKLVPGVAGTQVPLMSSILDEINMDSAVYMDTVSALYQEIGAAEISMQPVGISEKK